MHQCNISEPERFAHHHTLHREIAILKAELKCMTDRHDRLISDMEAIFANVRKGAPCYLEYTDHERIYIERAQDSDNANPAEVPPLSVGD